MPAIAVEPDHGQMAPIFTGSWEGGGCVVDVAVVDVAPVVAVAVSVTFTVTPSSSSSQAASKGMVVNNSINVTINISQCLDMLCLLFLLLTNLMTLEVLAAHNPRWQ